MNINLAVEKIRDAILDEITSGVRSEVSSVSENVTEAVDFAEEALRQLDEYTFSENVEVEIRDRVNEIIEDDLEKLIEEMKEEMKEENERVKWENHGTIMTLDTILQNYPLGSIVIAMPYSEQEVQGSPAFYLIDRIANEASGEKCLRRFRDMYAIPTQIYQDSKYVFFDSIHLLHFVDNLIERFNLKE